MTSHTPAARHAHAAVTPSDALVRRFIAQGKWHYLLLLPSDLARSILERKYDAFTTDAAYDLQPHGSLGPFGWVVDALVRRLPLHGALRQRLVHVSAAIADECNRLRQTGLSDVHVLTAPCGLMRDVIQASRHGSFRVTALDLDAAGDVIPEAGRRTRAALIDAEFARQDLLDFESLRTRLEAIRPAHVVNCIGLTPWISLDEVERLAEVFRLSSLVPGGRLIMDNFSPHPQSALGADLEIETCYHDPAAFRGALERAGFAIEAERTGPINTVTLARSR